MDQDKDIQQKQNYSNEQTKKQGQSEQQQKIADINDKVQPEQKIQIKQNLDDQTVSTEETTKKSYAQIMEQKEKTRQAICIEDNNINLVNFIGKKTQIVGRLKATNKTLSFTAEGKNESQQTIFEIPIGYIAKCERSIIERVTTIQIWMRYGCSIKLMYKQNKFQISGKTFHIINKLIQTSLQYALQYAFDYTSQFYCQRFACQNSIANAYQYDNDNWKILPNYPQKFLVPMSYLSKNNPEERIVVLSFSYQSGKNKLSFWRTGPGRSDSAQDDWIVKSRLPAAKSYTLQIKNKGIGTTKSFCSKAIELQCPYHIKQSFSNIFRIAYHNNQSLKWLANLNQTKWLDQIAVLLQQASLLVEKILQQQTQTITVISDYQARGAQLSALTQILLFPQYRSIKGFSKLLQAQFLQWAVPKSNKKQAQIDKGSVIIQFLDAVFQLSCIYPLSFEFNQNFLVFIAENIYSNRYGNFLLISRFMKQQQRQIIFKSCSIWQVLNFQLKDPGICSTYTNSFYVNYKQCDIYELRQYPSSKYLRIWNGFFFKKLKEGNPDFQIHQRYQNINKEHFNNKLKTEKLRLQLSQQHNSLIKKKQILHDLKANTLQ